MTFLDIPDKHETHLKATQAMPEAVHVFDEPSIQAINAALAARRPLLVRGEPGIGKSQLARAAAKELNRAYVQHVVDSRTEARDLLWHFDAVERLAEAQLCGALKDPDIDKVRADLAVANFIRPGSLWWAFHWAGAEEQAADRHQPPPNWDDGDPNNGCLVLIDEIDKAESDVPNGLLEALGAGVFHPHGLDQPVEAQGTPPLVLVTTNEERALPDAFVRRCLVLHLNLPKLPDHAAAFEECLRERGKAHFPTAHSDVIARAAVLLREHRETAQKRHQRPLPGQAEFLDLLRAVLGLKGAAGKQAQLDLLDQIAGFALQKQPTG